MNFTIDSKIINQVSKNMGTLLNAKTTIPVLTGVLTVVTEKEILFTVSDGTDTLVQRVMKSEDIQINESGIIVLPKDFFTTVRKMTGIIEVCTKGNSVTVTKGKTELTFTTMLADEYPKIDDKMPLSKLRYSGPSFREIVDATAFCVATSESRPVLMGVNLKLNGNMQSFVATDSHRLGKINVETSDCLEEDQDINYTIPANALVHALKTFDLSKDVFLYTFKNMIALANDNVLYYTQLLEGKYPDTDHLIPNEFTTEVIINRKECYDTVLLLKELRKDEDNVVQFSIDDGLFLKVAVKNELAKGHSEIAFTEKIGENLEIAFSSTYLLEALNAFESKEVKISFCGKMRPFIIRSTDVEETKLQLVLPVRSY